jgi:hypothetical protein
MIASELGLGECSVADADPPEQLLDGLPLERLERRDFAHLAEAHGPSLAVGHEKAMRAAAPGGSLPYDHLDAYAFERLCFLLLLDQGEQPRYWGRRGQAQQGIDLIFSNGCDSTVYQCKHHGRFTATELEIAVHKFEREWLSRPELGRPQKFVLCTSARLNLTTWETKKRNLAADLGITIEEWHRDTLDGWLRHKPGIVADLFGDRVAELFCGCGGQWDLGLFQPLVRGADKRTVDRYFDLLEADRIVRDPRDEAAFNEMLGRSRLVMLGGRAGAGKTMVALDLARAFKGGEWAVFHLRADTTRNVDQLFFGIKGRAFRPAIFVADDAHKAYDEIETLVRRLPREWPVKLVLTGRTPPEGMDMLDPAGTAFVQELRQDEVFLEIEADEKRFRAIIAKRRPDWANTPLDRLMARTGRDLAILDLVLDELEPHELDETEAMEGVFERLVVQLFDRNTIEAPRLRELAAVGQFDLALPKRMWKDLDKEAAKVAERFVVVQGRPPALAFRHPSAGEFVFRLLAWAKGEQNVEVACAADIAKVLLECAELPGAASVSGELLPRLLRTRLNLSDDGAIKRALLAHASIAALVTAPDVPLPTLSLATFLSGSEQPTYAAQLAARLEALAAKPETASAADVGLFYMFLRSLQVADSVTHAELSGRALPDDPERTQADLFLERLGAEAMARLVRTRGDLVALLGILGGSPGWFAGDLLQAFEPADLETLTGRTIAREGRVGTLGVRLRELGGRALPDGSGRTQADLFLERLGAEAMARLVRTRGDLVALQRILRYSPDWFTGHLLQAFEAADLETLIERTLAREGSVGTLGVGLRELRRRALPDGSGQTQADLFLERLGAEAMARLVRTRGDLVALLGILENSPDWCAGHLLQAFEAADLETLIERTLAREGSVGTLNLALRELSGRALLDGSGRTQLHLFEDALGEAAFWRLVLGAGNLNHLAYLLGGLSEGFRPRVLAPVVAPDRDGWLALTRRGSFYDPARFARDVLPSLPAATAVRVVVAVETAATDLVAASTWGEIGAGLAMLEEVEDKRVGAALGAAASARIAAVNVATLAFDDYEAATECISVLWRHCPAVRPELGAALWRVLPHKQRWLRTHKLLFLSRFLLGIARSEHVSEADARRVLEAFAPLASNVSIDPKSARYHALFFWNLFALWFERGRAVAPSFGELQTEQTWQRFVGVVEKRQNWRGNNTQKLDTLMLAGALAFLLPDLRPRLVALVPGKITGIAHLAAIAERDLTFVPAFLSLHGMALSASPRGIFTPERVALLLEKAAEYDERGLALDYACETLRPAPTREPPHQGRRPRRRR